VPGKGDGTGADCNKRHQVSSINTGGVVAVVFSCQAPAAVIEVSGSESRQLLLFLLIAVLREVPVDKWPKVIIYDFACGAKAYISNRDATLLPAGSRERAVAEEISRRLATHELELVYDEFHSTNHIAACRAQFSPAAAKHRGVVDQAAQEVAESLWSVAQRIIGSVRHMSMLRYRALMYAFLEQVGERARARVEAAPATRSSATGGNRTERRRAVHAIDRSYEEQERILNDSTKILVAKRKKLEKGMK
jgi:hypothetical protein